jgi:CDP-diacylglycerol--glycerol-3-phosphate 3-phosphatidyltransferase
MNLPNKLTVARCFLALIFVGLMSFENAICYIVAFVIFALAAATDWLDGKIARRYNLVTNFGKLLDPVADKVLLLGAFVMLMSVPALRLPEWTIVVIIARELLVTGARSLGASEGAIIPANVWGKVKTALQMGYVLIFLGAAAVVESMQTWPAIMELVPGTPEDYEQFLRPASFVGIVLVALFTLISGGQLVWLHWRSLKLADNI